MIIGAHAIVYSKDPDADRAFLRDVLALGHIDVGGGWLIFGLPPSEMAVHPAEDNGHHELYFLVDDVEAFIAEMTDRGIACAPVQNPGWGLLTKITLPGGGALGVYQPRHARPEGGAPDAATRIKKAAPKKSRAAKSRPSSKVGATGGKTSRPKATAKPVKKPARKPVKKPKPAARSAAKPASGRRR